MKKTKSLVASLVAIVICFAMLLGTTYAWFTDSVINTNTIIKSGNVSIELWHSANGTNSYEEVDGQTKLFVNVNGGQILWEPGVKATEDFQIKNVGTLALKYEFRVKALNQTVNAQGNTLTDVITMTVVDNANVKTSAIFGDGYVVEDTLLKGEVANYKIDLDWFSTENDNEYMDMEMLLAIELVATQVSYENDGYGNGFDNDAQYPIVSAEIEVVDLGAGQTAILETKGENPVSAVIPAELIETLPAEITKVALAHTEPVVGTILVDGQEKSAITFESIELIDQNGQIIDLEALGNVKEITITLPAQEQLAGAPVDVYHDGKYMATVNVGADGVISYTATHLCTVQVLPNISVGSIFRGKNPVEIDARLDDENSDLFAINYTVGGETYYVIADRATTRVFASTDTVYEQVNQNYTVETIAEGKLWEQFNPNYSAKAETTMVYMLPGTYKSGTTIDIFSSVDIIGLGDRDAVKVIKTSASSRHLFNCAVQKAEYGEITLKNLYLDATVKTTNNKDNGAVQAIRKTKVKCYDLTIVKDPSSNDARAFYLNAGNTNSYDGTYNNAYLYIENCRTNVKIAMYVVDGSGKNGAKAILQYNGLTYGANFDTPFTSTYISGGKVTIGAMDANDWWN